MTNPVLEIPIDTEKDNLFFVYFLYNSLGDVLYIGKTINLRARMRQHFVAELMKIEPWREAVDRNRIVTVKCNNACDMDLYETYFINKYKPIYNKDKIFNSVPSFEFPYVEPVTYSFKLKVIVGNGSFKDNCIRYAENEQDREILATKFPLIKQAYDKLGVARIKSLGYLQDRLIEELHFKDIKTQELLKIDIQKTLIKGQVYRLSELKDLMNNLYGKYDINKKGKAIDVGNYVSIKIKSLREGRTTIKVVEIL